MANNKKDPTLNFEASLTRLESLVQTMENGKLPLEEALKQFEEGMQLIKLCQTTLEQAEQKVRILTQQADGESLEPWSDDEK